jgi:hypothetical protein
MNKLAEGWKNRAGEKNIANAIEILREKFASVGAFGPQQLVEFHSAPDATRRRCTPVARTNWCIDFLVCCDRP